MPRLLVLLAAVCFGTTGTAQALGPDGASSMTVGAARIAVGAVLLLAYEWATTRSRVTADVHTTSAVTRIAWSRVPLAIGAVGVAAYQLCFFAAVKDTGVAVGTVVALGSAPALAGLGGWLLDGRVPGRAWAVATALACAGVAMLALEGGGEVSAPGVALAVGAGAAYAGFTLASKRLLDQGHQVEPVMARLFGLGAVLLAPVLVLGDVAWIATAGGAAMALWLGAVPTAIAYILFASGLRHLPANEVATLTLAEPVTAALLGAVVLGERPGVVAIAGIFIILAGLVVLAAPRRRRPVLEIPA
ncbi:MAG TPA: EamA family transporter [Baekduia sp.]|uniref:DMT family transporter n=1 Tax=Baekduia sp. TaxID=2600305 RepID=UPI002D780282|nr:EamA family transporter [Baekduia sp.]HET6505468.1 EamA family transporter [Baekduia sp.]